MKEWCCITLTKLGSGETLLIQSPSASPVKVNNASNSIFSGNALVLLISIALLDKSII